MENLIYASTDSISGVFAMRKNLLVSGATAVFFAALSSSVGAQSKPSSVPPWAIVVHREAMKVQDLSSSASLPPGIFPPVLGQTFRSPDATGVVETYNLAAPTVTKLNPFFQSLGTNGRACVTCHEPRSAWGVSAASIQERFFASGGTDPIFRIVDGATCPSDPVSTFGDKLNAYNLLLTKGVIRIFLPLPAARDFQITAVNDPYGCTNLTGAPPIVSVYRRPLPSANLPFLTECPAGQPGCTPLAIMWDGREPSLASQAFDATQGHAQALPGVPDLAQVSQIVAFESAIFDAQVFDFVAGPLDEDGATGGPAALSLQPFFIGINDSLSPGFDPNVFTLYDAWQNNPNPNRASVARGEAIFNTHLFTIHAVNGLNLFPSDPLGANDVSGTCTTCHDSPNVGNHSKKLALNIGVADAVPPVLDVSGLPSFTVSCTETSGPLAGQVFNVTDLGRAMITGNCADVGKVKGPILHGLAARAPYFHNGSAATLNEVVNFYNQRFDMELSDSEKADLVTFLQTL
jgi:cytochrome c peroxidase